MGLNKINVDVIGGGYSGLVQAFYLVEKGYSVRVFEKEAEPGGLLGSKVKNNFLNEQAANAFIANRAIEDLCRTVQIPLVSAQKTANKRFIYRDGKMQRLPLHRKHWLKVFKFVLSSSILKRRLDVKEKETLLAWGERTVGREATDFLLEPALQGVFATTADCLSARMVLDNLFKKARRGKLKGSVAPLGGMQDLVDGLTRYLKDKGCEFHFSQEWKNENSTSRKIFAVGLADLKELQENSFLELPESLKKTNTASLSSVKLSYKKNLFFKEGFGCLFPKSQGFNSLGVLFNHNIFKNRAPLGESSETWILNDQRMAFSRMSATALLRYVLSDRVKLTGQIYDPSDVAVDQWVNKIPVYDDELLCFNQDLEKSRSPHLFVGNYLGQLGLSKILFRAIENVEKLGRMNV